MCDSDIKIESIDGQEWAILSPITVTNGHPPPSAMAPPPAPIPQAPQAYQGWGVPPQNPAVAQQVAPQAIYQSHYGQMPTPVQTQTPQWGQPPPTMPPPVVHPPPHGWPSPTPVSGGPPHMGPAVAYASPPPVSSQAHYQGQAVYAPPSTPQPHAMWGGPPPGPTPPPQTISGLPPLGHPGIRTFGNSFLIYLNTVHTVIF